MKQDQINAQIVCKHCGRHEPRKEKMLSPYFGESINTMKAGRFELICANLFGKKTIGRDGYFTVTVSHWRGRSYLLDFRESK